MLRRRLVWVLGSLLVVGAGAVAGWQVRVNEGAATRSCGSVVDVLSGRVGWEQWWAADVAEPPDAGVGLLRTEHCPGAENARLLVVAGLGLLAVGLVGAAEVAHRAARTEEPPSARPADRLRSLGHGLVAVGVVLAAVGVISLALLLANPDATLFVYVSRSVVALIGLPIVLVPAAALIAAGRAIELLGRTLSLPRSDDATR